MRTIVAVLYDSMPPHINLLFTNKSRTWFIPICWETSSLLVLITDDIVLEVI